MPSRYVQRCAGECRRVLGNSSFKLIATGQRDTICRFCRHADVSHRTASYIADLGKARARLKKVRAQKSKLRQRLADVARQELALVLQIQRSA